jgi:hypothetical protein
MQISAGDSLKRFGVSNGQKIVGSDIRCDRDIRREIEVNRQWQKFVELEQVGIRNKWNVHNQCEYKCFRVLQVGDFHLEAVRGVVDAFSCHG